MTLTTENLLPCLPNLTPQKVIFDYSVIIASHLVEHNIVCIRFSGTINESRVMREAFLQLKNYLHGFQCHAIVVDLRQNLIISDHVFQFIANSITTNTIRTAGLARCALLVDDQTKASTLVEQIRLMVQHKKHLLHFYYFSNPEFALEWCSENKN